MKKIAAICLLAAMMLALLPMQAFAAETTEPPTVTEEMQPVETEASGETTPAAQENVTPTVSDSEAENGQTFSVEADAYTGEAANAVAENGPIKLGTPTNLMWGYTPETFYNQETGKVDTRLVEAPGSICWKCTEPCKGEIEILIYRQGESEPVNRSGWTIGENDFPEWMSVDSFPLASPGSGTYYFTIQVLGDGVRYIDSDTATSELWTYIQPDAALGACTNLSWDLSNQVHDGPAASWTNPEHAGGYQIEFYYAASADEEPHFIAMGLNPVEAVSSAKLFDTVLLENGDGYYYFKVRAFSSDITQYRHGAWSELSMPYHAVARTDAVSIYRMYNWYTQEHLLTSERGEMKGLIDAGWSLDGKAWDAPISGAPVYRLYNPFDDFHFYTMSESEIQSLLPLGWTVDGPVSFSATEADGNPVYRLFNPYATTNYHLFTASAEERDWLASLGWQIEGVAWYCAK